MNKIRRIDPNETRKIDFKMLFDEVIKIIEEHNPDSLHIGATFRKIKESAYISNELIDTARKSHLTKKIVKMRAERNNYVSAINMQAKAQLKTNEEDKIAAANVILRMIKYILKKFSVQSFNTQASLIKQFIDDLCDDEVKYQALKTLGVESTFIKLKELESKIKKTYFKRINEKVGWKKMHTQKNKRTLYQMMCRLFIAIEAAQMEHPEIDYEQLINELNYELTAQRSSNAKRLTRIQNKKKKMLSNTTSKEI